MTGGLSALRIVRKKKHVDAASPTTLVPENMCNDVLTKSRSALKASRRLPSAEDETGKIYFRKAVVGLSKKFLAWLTPSVHRLGRYPYVPEINIVFTFSERTVRYSFWIGQWRVLKMCARLRGFNGFE